ncbi:NAD(P)H:quinone oxidoreductase [Canna indica]|uniref:NAD(P)H dehydrogenase (quinone) n=1 Tax=Canna indica TaxID=4628 RepID=A0AAQ3JTX6_9LILI|nr:NAD(P)H:quinone oxidoreductase [Canna indica]
MDKSEKKLSWCGKAIGDNLHVLKDGLKICIENGKEVNLWNDPWIDVTPLRLWPTFINVEELKKFEMVYSSCIDANQRNNMICLKFPKESTLYCDATWKCGIEARARFLLAEKGNWRMIGAGATKAGNSLKAELSSIWYNIDNQLFGIWEYGGVSTKGITETDLSCSKTFLEFLNANYCSSPKESMRGKEKIKFTGDYEDVTMDGKNVCLIENLELNRRRMNSDATEKQHIHSTTNNRREEVAEMEGALLASQPIIKVAALCGSLRKGSFHRGLIRSAIQLSEESITGMNVELVDIAPLPFVNTDLEVDGRFPEPVEAFRDKIGGADAFLFASPEYNYSMTAPLKNAIDWGSRGTNLWADKPAAIVSAGGSHGGAKSQYHLRQVGVFVDLHFINKPELYVQAFHQQPPKFDYSNGDLIDPDTKERLKKVLLSLQAFTLRLKGK